jgi:hypothetical protein
MNCHNCVFSGEGPRVAPARVFIEFRTLGEGPRDHETLHHLIVLELVSNGIRVVWAGLLKESHEVVCRWSHLMPIAVRGSGRQNLAASLLVAYWVETLHSSSVVYLKMLLCLAWHGFHVKHSDHALASP